MTPKDKNNWFMYYEIQRLSSLGFKPGRIADYLGLDSRTVKKYLPMTPEEFEAHLNNSQHRDMILSRYEDFVKERLTQFPDTSTAQMHDWLKEHHSDLPEVAQRTVYNFVMFVRQKHNIPVVKFTRDYLIVEELPYGEQAQVDFGIYNMRLTNGRRKKVWFFTMVLSRSRMKYVWFQDKPFTSETVCKAHENAFAFFGGIPGTIVYDQDRILLVDENLGKIILTATFGRYVRSRNFQLHFCRKSDPESKGKVESVVKYVKRNFLTNRTYHDLETLNTEVLGWLDRTANYLPHSVTKKSPQQEHFIEKDHLKPYTPLTIENNETPTYIVRKNNVINYKGNFYSVPQGTYKGQETYATIKEKEGTIEIYNLAQELICNHALSMEKGKVIRNSNHKRDTSKSLEEMKQQVISHFTDQTVAGNYLNTIHDTFPRYTRDHLQVILRTLKEKDIVVADRTLDFCVRNQLFNGSEFDQVYQGISLEQPKPAQPSKIIKLLNENNLKKAEQTPQKSNMDDYEKIINS